MSCHACYVAGVHGSHTIAHRPRHVANRSPCEQTHWPDMDLSCHCFPSWKYFCCKALSFAPMKWSGSLRSAGMTNGLSKQGTAIGAA